MKPSGKNGPVSQETEPRFLDDILGALIASWIVMPWSTMLNVICSKELMIVAPPAAPMAANGLSSFRRSVGAMLLRGRLNGATSFAPGFPVARSNAGGKLKSVSSLLRTIP